MIPFVLHYTQWHYSKGVSDLLGVIQNFLWFFYHFFSIPTLLGTFFSPFQRLGEGYSKTFDPGQWAETFVLNSMMRIIGAVLRTMLIAMGVVSLAFTAVAGLVFFLVWLLAPLFVLFLIGAGLTFLAVI